MNNVTVDLNNKSRIQRGSLISFKNKDHIYMVICDNGRWNILSLNSGQTFYDGETSLTALVIILGDTTFSVLNNCTITTQE